nr:hypothetical protein [Tanacetum cinerariifolium]
KNYDPKGERFLIASCFPTPPLACAFFIPRATVKQKQEEKRIEEEQAANARYWKFPACCDDDDDYDSAITPNEPEEIIPIKIDQHHDNAESTHDSTLIISSKIDSLLDEFVGELTLLKSISPGINLTDRDPEEDIRLIERLFDSHMKEIDLSFNQDDPMPSSIEDDDDESERDILIHEELLDNYSLSLPVNGSFYFDIPSLSRPPAKPPDGNTGILNIKMMGDISE